MTTDAVKENMINETFFWSFVAQDVSQARFSEKIHYNDFYSRTNTRKQRHKNE